MREVKTTDVDLVKYLEQHNNQGRYDALIADCKSGKFHDLKHNNGREHPKALLLRELYEYPELGHLRQQVLEGYYDEDPQDIEDIRKMLKPQLSDEEGDNYY